MNLMIVEYIRYSMPDEDARKRLLAGYEAGRKSLEASPHCLAYEMAQCDEDPGAFVLRIEWDSADGHLQGFRRSAEFRAFYQAVAPFVANIAEMRHYHVTNITWRKAST
jgi:quinol monooxygenase YgiN